VGTKHPPVLKPCPPSLWTGSLDRDCQGREAAGVDPSARSRIGRAFAWAEPTHCRIDENPILRGRCPYESMRLSANRYVIGNSRVRGDDPEAWVTDNLDDCLG